jgi:hypothetical protein
MILDVANSIPRRSIKGMFFEWNPHDTLTDAYLFFHEQGPRLTLQFSGKEMHIFKDDVKWMVIYPYSRHCPTHAIRRKQTI